MICHGIHTLGWRYHFVDRMSEEGILSRAKVTGGKRKGVRVHAMKAYEWVNATQNWKKDLKFGSPQINNIKLAYMLVF
jgi:hypothetical protein